MATILLARSAYELDAFIRRALTGEGHIVLGAPDAAQLFVAVERDQPALVILDPFRLVGGNGVQVCHDLRTWPTRQSILIVVVSNHDAIDDKLAAFTAGADDYITTPFFMPELLLRVGALLRRQARMTRTPASARRFRQYGDIALDTLTGDVWCGERRIIVTPVEARLLDYLMTCAGRAVSAEELLQRVWTQQPGCGDPALVRVHIRHLREKLAVLSDNADEVLKTVPRFGYCMVPVGIT